MTTTSDGLIARLNRVYPAGVQFGTVALINYTGADYAFAFNDVNIGADTITITGNDFVSGTRLEVSAANPPAPLYPGQRVYVISTGDSFQISETIGGLPIGLTTSGSGTMALSDISPVALFNGEADHANSLADVLRFEVDYQGQLIRPTFTPPTAIYESTLNVAILPKAFTYAEVNNLSANDAGAVAIQANGLVIIKDGETTPGSTAGTMEEIILFDAPVTLEVDPAQPERLTFEMTYAG